MATATSDKAARKAEVKTLLKKLAKTSKDADARNIRAKLRRLGHKGGLQASA